MSNKRNDRKAIRKSEAEARTAAATKRTCGHKHTDNGALVHGGREVSA